MKNSFFQLKSFIAYWLDNVDEHSLHSPFFFKLYGILKDRAMDDDGERIELLRKELLKDDRSILVDDLGAGSSHFKSSTRKISDIARTSVTPRKYSGFYSRIIKANNYTRIIELGTSLGINTLYLSLLPASHVTTFEGSESIADIAQRSFDAHGSSNIKIVRGNIDTTLTPELAQLDMIDFALIDANHRCTPTLDYFHSLASKVHPESVIALDDIHSSQEMERAWKAILADSRVQASADLFRCGLVFFNPSLNRQHVVLRF